MGKFPPQWNGNLLFGVFLRNLNSLNKHSPSLPSGKDLSRDIRVNCSHRQSLYNRMDEFIELDTTKCLMLIVETVKVLTFPTAEIPKAVKKKDTIKAPCLPQQDPMDSFSQQTLLLDIK
ncbi:hypothetical protein QAD02_000738 [Eretmocerus hayati]|uniref:Uncharacterized protein n=1 Tax=Eretmocerus hayati TaxID=131215 RepID=A0ACC2NEH4_9HYME|nr:hypothetical protein QAD02_000738 [Eretmocerus hayati]